MRVLLWGGAAALVGVWLYRQIGFIRMERPDVEQRKDLFASTAPKYRRTQEPNRWRLKLRNPRVVRRRHSA